MSLHARVVKKLVRTMKKEAMTRLDVVSRDMEPAFTSLFADCHHLTMTSPERMYALYKAVEYLVRNRVPGDLVECGVWKGGSSMMMALALAHFGDTTRTLYLYDTFAGMPAPGEADVDAEGRESASTWERMQRDGHNEWCYSPLDEVKANLARTGYPADRVVYVQGKVEDTIPGTRPERIALLRLDTDWYASTRHELEHLYPALVPGGVLVLDDYGAWQGARHATDEYFAGRGLPLLLNRIDETGRIAVKCHP
ncbi:MAG: TylF/MycF/NovP-related O-methyltransferase [Longimicrobiaceae bacterium]